MIAYHARNCWFGVANDLAVLHIETLDFSELTGPQELRDHCHLLRRVHPGFALAIEVFHTDTVWVEVTTIRIAGASIAVERVRTTAPIVCTDIVALGLARMRCQSRGNGVRLPDIHLSAELRQIEYSLSRQFHLPACTLLTNASIRIRLGCLPTFCVGLTIDVLQVSSTLSITVS